ncbi:MAG TPA: glycosyl hydrolase, partial [Thermoanaerobaculia bacterium]|nr:glycosyl hydrolase [Thermoanaerobaculia bacterium]
MRHRRRCLARSHRLWIVVAAATGIAAAGPAAGQRPAPEPPSTLEARLAAWEQHQRLDRESELRNLEWRSIGPNRQGGRVVDIEQVPGRPGSYYAAFASGGLWRTDDHGLSWRTLFDQQPTVIMGDVAVDPRDPDRVWVGSGENNSSRSSYGGLGVYRSDDGGETWRFVGLGDSDRVGRILVDPRDSNRVYVAVLGRLYTPGGPRGLYRTTDGGASWQLVLDTADEEGRTGVVDLVMDPRAPDTLYAAAWERFRRPWDFVEGGDGSGIYKSTDGGDTWTRLGGGLPQGEHVGRIGLAIAPSDPQIVYAALDNQELLPEEEWDLGGAAVTAKRLRRMNREELLEQDPEAIEDFIRASDLDASLTAKTLIDLIESEQITLEEILGELDDANANLFASDIRGLQVWRSEDGGATWRLMHDEPLRDVVYTYGYYFGQIRVAPDDADRIYLLGVPLVASSDGGRSFESLADDAVHVDHHALWIDPADARHLLLGNDGGIDESWDAGVTWRRLDDMPVGQFYTVAVDMAEPYNVYGGLQDNGTMKGSSRSRPGEDEWQFLGGGDGMHVQIDPADGTTYVGFQFGFYFRIDSSGKRVMVRPRDALKEPALRYNWSTPILLSEHNRDILYFGTNRLYRSFEGGGARGADWAVISPELTASTLRGDVPFGTVTTISESPLRFGLLWVGTDDGELHVSDGGGVEWRAAAAGLPADRWVTRVEASRHVLERAYVSQSGYRDDDLRPYLHVSEDLGRSWRSIAAGLPAEPVNVIREDPVNPDVLYVGTDRGVYVSLDRGGSWQALGSGMPNAPVHDLVVHPRERELVAGTHGRSVWIVDVLPVQELAAVRGEAVHVFPLAPVKYQRWWRSRPTWWWSDWQDELP